MDKKNKRTLIFLISGIVILSSFLIGYFIKTTIDYVDKKNKAEKIISDFYEIYESNEKKAVLFASPYCPYCEMLKPTLNEVADENNFTYYYFDTSFINKDIKAKFVQKTGINYEGIPYLVVLEDKTIIDESIGNKNKNDLILFLTETGIIENEEGWK